MEVDFALTLPSSFHTLSWEGYVSLNVCVITWGCFVSDFIFSCITDTVCQWPPHDLNKCNSPHTRDAHQAYQQAHGNHQVFLSTTQKVELISFLLIGITPTPPVYSPETKWIFMQFRPWSWICITVNTRYANKPANPDGLRSRHNDHTHSHWKKGKT